MRGGFLAMLLILSPALAHAQGAANQPSGQRPVAQPAASESIGVRGFVTFGSFSARSRDTFEAVLGANAGPIFGGGVQVLLPYGLYGELAASRFRREGERVFVGPDQEVFRLGIPLEVTLTPVEITGGWRYRHCPRTPKSRAIACRPSVIPYVGGGFSSYRYQETSDLADDDEDNVDERFTGFHVLGGVDYRATAWLGVGGEVVWSTIPDALAGGVAAAFNESDLGGATFRVKISIGR